MKTQHDNSYLDNFLRDTLKNLDVQYQQSDWSDMESLLGPAQKPIDFNFNISKKTILISASVIVIAVIGIIISQTVHFGNSSSDEISPQHTDSPHSLLNAVDTQKTTVAVPGPITPAIDSAKIKSSALVQANKIADSIKAAASIDTASTQKLNDKQKNSAANINQKQDKKQKKNNPADTSTVKTNSIQLPPIDTASKHPVQEIKIETPPAPADSSKSSAPSKKSRKNKKNKNISADSSKAKIPSQAKTDSLK